jgi:hypothetical protein
MKENNFQPDDSQLSALLRESRGMPALPPRFQQNVWRRIEDAEASVRPAAWLDSLAALILRPRFAVAVASVLLLAGILSGTLEGWQVARHDAQVNYLAAVAPQAAR